MGRSNHTETKDNSSNFSLDGKEMIRWEHRILFVHRK